MAMRWKSALTVATKRQTRRVSLTLLPDGRPLTFLFSVDFQPVKIVLIYFISLHCQPRNIDYQWLFFTGLIGGVAGVIVLAFRPCYQIEYWKLQERGSCLIRIHSIFTITPRSLLLHSFQKRLYASPGLIRQPQPSHQVT